MQVLKDEILPQYKLGTEQDGIILRYVQSVDAQGINDSRIPVAGNGNYWCARRDSNSQPSDPKSDALSIELRTRVPGNFRPPKEMAHWQGLEPRTF